MPTDRCDPTQIMRFGSLASHLAVVLLLAVSLGSHPGPDPDRALERVQRGLESADPDLVLTDMPSRVEIVLFGQGGMFGRAQATLVLRDFFRRHPPGQVAFSEPSSSEEGQTATGRYRTNSGGTPLSVRVTHRARGNDWSLASIRIDQRSAARSGGR